METIYTRENPDNLERIRHALQQDGAVKVVNEYETFYGVGFDRWLRNGLADLPCEFKVLSWCKWYNYPWSYLIKLK